MGKGVGGAEGEAEILCLFEAPAEFKSQTMIETVARRNELLDVRARRIRPEVIQRRQGNFNRCGWSKAVEVY